MQHTAAGGMQRSERRCIKVGRSATAHRSSREHRAFCRLSPKAKEDVRSASPGREEGRVVMQSLAKPVDRSLQEQQGAAVDPPGGRVGAEDATGDGEAGISGSEGSAPENWRWLAWESDDEEAWRRPCTHGKHGRG